MRRKGGGGGGGAVFCCISLELLWGNRKRERRKKGEKKGKGWGEGGHQFVSEQNKVAGDLLSIYLCQESQLCFITLNSDF